MNKLTKKRTGFENVQDLWIEIMRLSIIHMILVVNDIHSSSRIEEC